MKIKVYQYLSGIIIGAISCLACAGMSRPEHFNRLAEEESEGLCGRIIDACSINTGDTVADLGAGGGYYSMKLAEAVGNEGRVYAVDIDPECVDYIEKLAKKNGRTNVSALLASPGDPALSVRSVDLVFVRNAYHDIADHVPYFAKLRGILKPGGRIAIIDYRPYSILFRIFGHFSAPEKIVSEMNEAGYDVFKKYGFLKKQSFIIFRAR